MPWDTVDEYGLDEFDIERARRADRGVWVRRALLLLLLVVPVLGLLNVFGQSAHVAHAAGPAGELRVTAPSRVRGGLLYQVRLEVDARRTLRQPTLVLDPGWFQALSVNSVVPDPQAYGSRDGRVSLAYDAVGPGRRLVVWIYFQANPTNVGRRSTDVRLLDADRQLLVVHRTITIFP